MAHIILGNVPQANKIKSIVEALRTLRQNADTVDLLLDSFVSAEQAGTLAELLGMEEPYDIQDMVDLKEMFNNLKTAVNTADLLEIQWRIL